MSSAFAKEVISQINEFRQNPEYVSKNCELFHLGLSRLNKKLSLILVKPITKYY